MGYAKQHSVIPGLVPLALTLLVLTQAPSAHAQSREVVCPEANQVKGYIPEAPNSRRLANATPTRFSNVEWAVQYKSYGGVFPILARATLFRHAIVGDGTLRCHYQGKPIDFVVKPQRLFGRCKAVTGFRRVGNFEKCERGASSCVVACN